MSREVCIWNLPVRLFHWLLVGSFITAWLTRDDRYLDIHVFAGYLMGGLILFRLAWGFWGGPYARFRDFAFGWRAARDYMKQVLKRCPPRFIGHNPAGSWGIYMLLGMGLLMAVTGLLALGGEERHGPFAGWLDYAQGAMAHELHEWLAWVMLGVVVIHLLGVVVESVLHRENLVASMITGRKEAPPGTVPATAGRLVAGLMLAAVIAAGFGWFYGYLVETPEQPYRPFVGQQLPDNELWREECGACHLAFHPSLLPARSWRLTMEEQASHFGEDLFLEQDAIDEITAFLTANASEQALTEAAWKIGRSIPETEMPRRITDTRYWMEKHSGIPEQVWRDPKVNGRVNCASCHLDAEEGTFEDAAMRIPVEMETPSATLLDGIFQRAARYFSFNSSLPDRLDDKG